MKYLITGGCGFLGSNLASEVLKSNGELAIFDNLSRFGAMQNLDWLFLQDEFLFRYGDIRDSYAVSNLVKDFRPDIVFHLAGQVAMTTSIVNPRLDFEVNALGTLNVLEAVREHCPDCGILYSSTNKVFGDLEYLKYEETSTRYVVPSYPNGFDASIRLDFHSPYGCSKGAADQYLLDYSRIFGLKTVVFRHSSMYGGRQFATYDQGWLGWFCQKAVEIKKGELRDPFTVSGNGKQVRDLLYAKDTVNLYIEAAKKIATLSGRAFCVGGGIENSLSLLELFSFLESELDIRLIYKRIAPRVSDQKFFVADNQKVKEMIGWQPEVNKVKGIRKMLEWIIG